MRLLPLCVLVLVGCVEDVPKVTNGEGKEVAASDWERMQGTWYNYNTPMKREAINGRGEKFVIVNDEVIIGGRPGCEILAVDNGRIDMKDALGVYFGIYEFSGGGLRICYGEGTRPRDFGESRTVTWDLRKTP